MLLPLDIMTENEQSGEDRATNLSGYALDLQTKLKRAHAVVRDNLQKASLRQKKQYDCRVREYKYSVGDLVFRNQRQVLPGRKAKIQRDWTGPWKIVEKLCDVLFRIQQSPTLPSVVIHGDNIKRYTGNREVHLDTGRHDAGAAAVVVNQHNLRGFRNEFTRKQNESSG